MLCHKRINQANGFATVRWMSHTRRVHSDLCPSQRTDLFADKTSVRSCRIERRIENGSEICRATNASEVNEGEPPDKRDESRKKKRDCPASSSRCLVQSCVHISRTLVRNRPRKQRVAIRTSEGQFGSFRDHRHPLLLPSTRQGAHILI